MNIQRKTFFYSLVLIVMGVAIFVYAGYDDSPGGQLLGVLAVLYGIVRFIRKP